MRRDENFGIVCAELAAIGIWIFHLKLQALVPGVNLDILQNSGYFVWLVAIYGWLRARLREREMQPLAERAARGLLTELRDEKAAERDEA